MTMHVGQIVAQTLELAATKIVPLFCRDLFHSKLVILIIMMLSRTSQYAVQALIYMAIQPAATPVLNKDIAARLGVPAPYLTKILQNMVKGDLLISFRGRLGGFCLREGAGKTSLMQILKLTEGPTFTETCLLGLKVCSDETACPLHAQWSPLKKKLIKVLEETTLDKLAHAVNTGKYRLCDIPGGLFGPLGLGQGRDASKSVGTSTG